MKIHQIIKWKWLLAIILLTPFLSFSQDYKWEWVIEPQFDDARFFYDGLAVVTKNGETWEEQKQGYINQKGELVIDYKYSFVQNFSEGLAVVNTTTWNQDGTTNSKWGYIDKNGNLKINQIYNGCRSFGEGLASVRKENENYGYIDKNGKTKLDFFYLSAGIFSEGLADVKFPNGNELGITSRKVHFIDKNGEVRITTDFDGCWGGFSEGIAIGFVNQENNSRYQLYGAIDKSGNKLFEPKYKFITEFNEGYAVIKTSYYGKCKYGYIKTSGALVIDTIFDNAFAFSNGIAAVRIDEKCGFINKRGDIVISISVQDLKGLSEGLAAAKQNGKWGFIRLLNEYEQVFRYVNLELDKWDDKGKYEKLSDYQVRVNENTRKIKIKELQQEALGVIGSELFERKCQNKSFDYDPESEIFKIDVEAVPAIFVRVPIDEALSFDENFEKIEYKSFSWGLDDKQILITKATLFNPLNNKSYIYDINTPITFKKVEVLANFNPIDIEDISTIDKADQKETIETMEFGLSDVDVDIPKSTIVKDKTYCLIIGNEDYTKYQPNLNTESNVDFAINDARIFSEYCNKTLGVPKENITLLEDAISSQMKREIMRLSNKTKYSTGDVELIFYYSGHGFPDNETKEGYIMPVDIAGANVSDGIKLSKLYQDLTEYPTKKVTVILDACFSGGGRNQGLLAAKGVKVKPKENLVQGNLVVFAASSSDQESLFYEEEQHGLFTYYLLKKLKETKGEASYQEMYDYLKIKVPSTATDKYYKEQNPIINISSDVESKWKTWKFK